jgi:uncharacterized membrane protein
VTPSPATAVASSGAIERMRLVTVLLTVALVVLGSAWETVLAPLRPGGSLLVLKVLPLLLVLPAFWSGRIRSYQLWSMLILAYLCEGVVRGMSDGGRSSLLGWIEAAFAVAIYAAILRYVTLRRRAAGPAAAGSSDRTGS